MSRSLYALFVLISLLLCSFSSKAEQPCTATAFAIENVRIDEISETGTKAREIGLNTASSDAFYQILSRLLLDQEDVLSLLSEVKAEDYLGYMHIHNETTLARRYLGEIDFCFDANEIRTLFRQNGLAWAELVSPAILTMPIWKEASGAVVWNQNNNWLRSWYQHSDTYNGLLTFVSIDPDIKTRRQLREEAIFAEDPEVLKIALDKVNASQILTVIAEIDHSSTVPVLRFRSRLFDEEAKPIATLIEESHALNGTKNIDFLFEQFRLNLTSELEKFWKLQNQISPQTAFTMTVRVATNSLTKWRSLQATLSSMPIIRNVEPLSLSDTSGFIRITLSGDLPQFRANLIAEGYRVIDQNNELFITEK
ncbi:hypothetical protein N9P07_00675 [Alphaproteobacteria bacterium]|nr:hypothetical protein [Alphaproteobacteria bacterium]MBT5799267.1 hypothetical protein [Alphaproteobacteria bacterium]MDA9189929.1 hypothetical protein [Alphaproteobacteria bacterium]